MPAKNDISGVYERFKKFEGYPLFAYKFGGRYPQH
jgi:hypothetical protein